MIQKIIDTKNPIIRQKSKPVTKIDKKIKELAKDLVDTLRVQKEPEGVGLAAVQIGKLVRMFAMVYQTGFKVIINPQVISSIPNKKKTGKKTNKKNSILEGCLSVPFYYGPLKRKYSITISYQEVDGTEKTETFTDFPAQIVQHELDHLEGVLFTDHILTQKKPLYKIDPKTDEWEEVEI